MLLHMLRCLQCPQFQMLSDVVGSCMYLKPKDGEPPRRVILSDEERDAVLAEVHAGHFGVKRMMGKINQGFFWRGMAKDVEDWVSKTFG